MNDLILQPILFMGLLSTAMMILMYATRIPAAKVLGPCAPRRRVGRVPQWGRAHS